MSPTRQEASRIIATGWETFRSFAFDGVGDVKLKRLRDGVHRLPSIVGYLSRDASAVSRQRDQTLAWRKWYKTARWQKLRWSVLVRDLFTCHICSKAVSDTSLLVADHIKPHRGDLALFWDEGNLQCLCKACHDTVKQREEAATRWVGGV